MKEIPDTLLVKEASKIVKAALSENIWNHSMRSYFLADSYAVKKQINYSQKELILASLFHDIGFYKPYRIKGKSFQIAISLALKEYLIKEKNIAKSRINAMMEAIDFHCQFEPRWSIGEISGLLQIGTHMDVMGKSKDEVDKESRKLIFKEYPKKDFLLEFNQCLFKSITGIKSIIGILKLNICQDKNHYCSES